MLKRTFVLILVCLLLKSAAAQSTDGHAPLPQDSISKYHTKDNLYALYNGGIAWATPAIRNGDHDAAIGILSHALNAAWRAPATKEEHNELARLHLYQAIANSGKGDFIQAKNEYTRALDYYQKGDKDPYYRYVYAVDQLATIYTRIGENKMAEQLFRSGTEVIQDTTSPYYRVSHVAIYHNNLGLNYQNQGRWPEAKEEFEKGLTLQGLTHQERGMLEANLAQWHQRAGNHVQATEYVNRATVSLRAAIVENERSNAASFLANAYKVQGLLLQEAGQSHAAITYFDQGLTLLQELHPDGKHRQLGKMFGAKANCLIELKQYDQALAACHAGYQSLGLSTNDTPPHLPDLNEVYSEVTMMELLNVHAHVFYEKYRDQKSTDDLKRALAVHQFYFDAEFRMREAFLFNESNYLHLGELHQNAQRAVAICLELSKREASDAYLWQALCFSENAKGLLLSASLHQRNTDGYPPEVVTLIEEIKEAELNRSLLENSLVGNDFPGHRDSLARHSQRLSKLQDEFKNSYPYYYQQRYQPMVPQPDEITAFLSSRGRHLLSVLWGAEACYLLLATPTGTIRAHTVANPQYHAAELEALIGLMAVDTGSAGDVQQLAELSHQTYLTFLHPLFGDELPAKLYLIPDGPLGRLPLGALCQAPVSDRHNFSTWPFLILRTEINYAPSLRFLLRPQRSVAQHQHYKIAFHAQFENNYRVNPHLSPLFPSPNGEREAEIWNAQVYTGKAVTAERFLTEAKHYRMIEVFTHAHTDTLYPERSGLYFEGLSHPTDSGYILTAALLQSIDVQAQLSILIGCGTGSGLYIRGEGVQSLARQFAYIGSDNTLGSLWMPNQDPARRFLDGYNLQLHSDQNPGRALRRTKVDRLTDANVTNREKHPSQWACFVLMGVGDDLPPPPETGFGWWWLLVVLLLGIGLLVWRRRKSS